MIQAVVLAGGKGTRLRPLTYTVPKPMVPVCGKPFLQHQIELLRSQGFGRILMLVSYLGRQIEDHFGDGSAWELDIQYAYEPSPMGTGGALKNAENVLADQFVLLNGDTLLPIDYGQLVGRFRELKCTGLVVAYTGRHSVAPNNIKAEPGGRVMAYNKEDPGEMTHVDAGAIVLNKDVLHEIMPGCTCSLEKDVFPRLIHDGELYAYPTSQRFYDMGSFSGLRQVEEILG